MTTGVYIIRNLANGKIYVGSSVAVEKRWNSHRLYLRRGAHDNSHLQRAWRKYGEDQFAFDLLQECAREDLLRLEKEWFVRLSPFDGVGYNVVRDPATCIPAPMSEEARRKLSAAKRGQGAGVPLSPEHRAAIGRALTGKPKDRAAVEKRSSTMRGRPLSESHRRRISEVQRGRVHSEAARRNMSKARIGRVVSRETREKIAASLRGRKRPTEVVEKSRAARWGR